MNAASRLPWVLTFALVGCAQVTPPPTPTDGGDAGCGCTRYGVPAQVGTTGADLNELSGLVASRTQPGIFWAHNDSGDTARFFAMHLDGTVAQTFAVTNAVHVDWEDVGLGPCPTGTCVVLGDIGDNKRVRGNVVLYRVTEPTIGGDSNVLAEAFSFTYPNGAHNAEAMFVAPDGRAAYVITKEPTGPSDVFKVSLATPGTQVAERVTTLKFPAGSDANITAAGLSPCGDVIAVRMYNRLVTLTVPAGQPLEAAFEQEPVTLPSTTELQSEAVAFSADGRAIITSSEQATGSPVPVWQTSCH